MVGAPGSFPYAAIYSRWAQTLANKNAELKELKEQVTRLALASAVLTQKSESEIDPTLAPDNVVPLPPPNS
ncbi:hypothetical protein ACFVZI_52755, partial [Streptomyces mirabilis]